MRPATPPDEERIAQLLRLLPPAPAAWVEAAQELPQARAGLDELVERAKADAEFRARLMADLEAALEDAGHEARPALVAVLRAQLPDFR